MNHCRTEYIQNIWSKGIICEI